MGPVIDLSAYFMPKLEETDTIKIIRPRKNRNHRNRKKLQCKQGHPFTEENTYLKKVGNSVWRVCRICNRNQQRKHRNDRAVF
jgi:hypothetical protein